MNFLRYTISFLATAFLFSGCAGSYSVKEATIRNRIPQEFLKYTNGIVASPSDADIQAAIALGSTSKERKTLQYAYLTKAPRGVFDNDTIYVQVATPLFLIADHARE